MSHSCRVAAHVRLMRARMAKSKPTASNARATLEDQTREGRMVHIAPKVIFRLYCFSKDNALGLLPPEGTMVMQYLQFQQLIILTPHPVLV